MQGAGSEVEGHLGFQPRMGSCSALPGVADSPRYLATLSENSFLESFYVFSIKDNIELFSVAEEPPT